MHLFKDALNEALKKTGKLSASLADEIKIGRSRISEFTIGKSLPKDDTIVAICKAFSPPLARNLAQAWVRERLGAELSESILASDSLKGTALERLLTALPAATMRAFQILMQAARDDEDLRVSLERLAAYITPEETPEPPKAPPSEAKQNTPGKPHPRFEVKGILGEKDLKPSADDLSASRLNEATEEQEEVEQLRKRLDELTKEKGSQTR